MNTLCIPFNNNQKKELIFFWIEIKQHNMDPYYRNNPPSFYRHCLISGKQTFSSENLFRTESKLNIPSVCPHTPPSKPYRHVNRSSSRLPSRYNNHPTQKRLPPGACYDVLCNLVSVRPSSFDRTGEHRPDAYDENLYQIHTIPPSHSPCQQQQFVTMEMDINDNNSPSPPRKRQQPLEFGRYSPPPLTQGCGSLDQFPLYQEWRRH